MNKLIKAYKASQKIIIDYIENTETNTGQSTVIHNSKHEEPPHEDFSKACNDLIDFYNVITSPNQKTSVKVSHLDSFIGSTVSKRVLKTWNEDFVDEDTGDFVSVERNEILIDSNEVITQDNIQDIKTFSNDDEIFIYKKEISSIESKNKNYLDLEKISFKYTKGTETIESLQMTLIQTNKVPLTTKGQCKIQTPEIMLNMSYQSFYHNEIQSILNQIVNNFNNEVNLYLNGKNGITSQPELFD